MAQSGDIHAISNLIQQKFTSKVIVTPNLQFNVLTLTIQFFEKTDSKVVLKIVAEILNEIKPSDVKFVQIISVGLWTSRVGYLSLVSGSYVNTTKSTYTVTTIMLSLLVLYCGYALFIYKPISTTTSSSSSRPTRVSLGVSKTGYELFLEGSCVIVKDIKTSDFARLNTDLEGFKNAVKQETGYQCVLFE